MLLISSELEEVLGLAHRVLVMRAGRIVGELRGEQMTESAVLAAAFAASAPGARLTGRTARATRAARRARALGSRVAERLRATGIALPFAALFVTLSIASSSFLTKVNLLNILDQQAAILIIAAAGTLVLVAGGIDLSVGAVYALAGVTARRARARTRRRWSPSSLGVAVGLAVGLVNGLVVTRLRINALIATLAMSFVVSGLGTLITHGNLVVLFEHPEFGDFARTHIFTVKSSIWIALVAVVVIGVLLARTTAGRYMYAVWRQRRGGAPGRRARRRASAC